MVIFAQTRKKYNRACQGYNSNDLRFEYFPNPHYASSLDNSATKDIWPIGNIASF
jgi:hypothetical protein